jgi:hypothetical protein
MIQAKNGGEMKNEGNLNIQDDEQPIVNEESNEKKD